jgi:hypothetical protein
MHSNFFPQVWCCYLPYGPYFTIETYLISNKILWIFIMVTYIGTYICVVFIKPINKKVYYLSELEVTSNFKNIISYLLEMNISISHSVYLDGWNNWKINMS